MLQTFSKHLQMCLSVVVFISAYCFMCISCSLRSSMLRNVSFAYICILYIFVKRLHFVHILHIVSQFVCTYAYNSFQEDFCPEDVPYSSLPTLSKSVLRAMLPDVEIHEISLHEGDECTCDSDLACQTLNRTMMSCRNGW